MLPYTALDGIAAMRARYGLLEAARERGDRRTLWTRWFQRTAAAGRVGAPGREPGGQRADAA